MKKHQMKLTSLPFKKIIDGEKIIESRLYDKKRHKINVGDEIEFICKDKPSEKVIVKVKAIYLYNSFSELFSDFPPEHFGGDSKQKLIEEISNFYSDDEQ